MRLMEDGNLVDFSAAFTNALTCKSSLVHLEVKETPLSTSIQI